METQTHKEKRKGDKARATMQSACLAFLRKCAGQTTNPLLFATLARVAEEEFGLKFDGPVKLDDVCFVRIQKEGSALDEKMIRRKHGNKTGKKKYELPSSENVIASLSREELRSEEEHKAEG